MEFSVVVDESYEALVRCFKLGELHYNEVEEVKSSSSPYNVNYDLLKQLHSSGMVVVVLAESPRELVGYFVSIITPDIFTSKLNAQEIGFFVSKECRGKGLSAQMFERIEEELVELGVTTHLISYKEGHEHQAPEGYIPTERVYMKMMGE